MSSLVQDTENAATVRRIESLTVEARPAWGKMNVAQMLAHCQIPFRVAAGELKLKRGLVGRLFGRIAKKKFVLGSAPFKRNLPTDPKFLAAGATDFDRERACLIELVQRYGETGAVTTDPHPFFGPMSAQEWDTLMWKHVDHHLRQFGV